MTLQLSQLDGTNGFRVDESDAYDLSGYSVAGAGDVSGDGIDDVIVGARGSFASYVVFGSDAGFAASLDLAGLDGSNGFRLNGDYSTGFSASTAGDVNGDGIDDVIVGAPSHYLGTGQSYVVFGTDAGFAASLNLAGLDGTNGLRLDGATSYSFSGASVSAAGDVYGDGIDDMIVGAPFAYPGGDS